VSFLIRPAEPSDRPEVFRLFSAVFKEEAQPAEWTWKYDENPSRSTSAVAFDGEKAVGFFGGFATRYRGASGSLPGTSAVDVMTDPGARRLGSTNLYRNLGEAFVRYNGERGIPFCFGFPHDRALRIGKKLLGYQTVEPVGQWSRELPTTGLLRRLKRRLLKPSRIERFDTAHDTLADAVHARPGWRTDRSTERLNWRYARRLGVGYQLFRVVDPRAREVAYAVVREVGTRALLVDLELVDEESGALGDLLHFIADELRPSPLKTLEIRASRTSRLATRLAEELGFTPIASDTCLAFIPVAPSFDLAPALARFDYRYGDADIF
jgi:hypothetical protein